KTNIMTLIMISPRWTRLQTDMLETAFPGFQAPVTSTQMGEMVAWFAQNGQQFFNGKVLPVSVSTP
ncbi:MAG: hypothetical protein AAFN93_26495, partial [Bacteroidota bacterium]